MGDIATMCVLTTIGAQKNLIQKYIKILRGWSFLFLKKLWFKVSSTSHLRAKIINYYRLRLIIVIKLARKTDPLHECWFFIQNLKVNSFFSYFSRKIYNFWYVFVNWRLLSNPLSVFFGNPDMQEIFWEHY